MATCAVPVSCPEYDPPINYSSDLYGSQPSINTEYNCELSGTQYPYAAQDHLALRHLAFKNYVRPLTLDGKTVHKPYDEKQYSCDCKLSNTPWTSKYNNEALKFEVKSGVLKRGCDCIKRNGLQDRCPRVRHEGRWDCIAGLTHQTCASGSSVSRNLYANHLQRRPRSPYRNPCQSVANLRDLTRQNVSVLRSPSHRMPKLVSSQTLQKTWAESEKRDNFGLANLRSSERPSSNLLTKAPIELKPATNEQNTRRK